MYANKMDTLSCLRQLNKITDTDRYRIEKLSSLLPKVQTEKFD